MFDIHDSTITELSQKYGYSWPTINSARKAAHVKLMEISKAIEDSLGPLGPDADMVVFGSLARGEWTSGSDIDWTLLIDGQVDERYQRVIYDINQVLMRLGLRPPGNSGVFGQIAFSHELVHQIGGDDDLNSNMTRRMLLLLESRPLPIGGPRVEAFERTIRAILARYLHNDAAGSRPKDSVPRFLLNDVVRFWRTMCVDFAWKAWEQSGRKWAIRNIKLRFSRKLLFVSGMLSVFACRDSRNQDETLLRLYGRVLTSPLDNLAEILSSIGLGNLACICIDHYERFLRQLDNEEVRQSLEALRPEDAYDDEKFRELRELSHEFQDALTRIFFVEDTPLRNFTKDYGVF